jgi:hypothetical protein
MEEQNGVTGQGRASNQDIAARINGLVRGRTVTCDYVGRWFRNAQVKRQRATQGPGQWVIKILSSLSQCLKDGGRLQGRGPEIEEWSRNRDSVAFEGVVHNYGGGPETRQIQYIPWQVLAHHGIQLHTELWITYTSESYSYTMTNLNILSLLSFENLK